MEIQLDRVLRGRILDVGGGGEGIIGRLYTNQVVAIDNRREELEEAPEGFEKMLMDATELDFPDQSFDHVTFFFTLMFMTTHEQQRAIEEAARVLRPGGQLHIWDCEISCAYPEPFCVDVDILLPEERVCTTYGVGKLDIQDENTIRQMCLSAGLTLVTRQIGAQGFSLGFKKVEQ